MYVEIIYNSFYRFFQNWSIKYIIFKLYSNKSWEMKLQQFNIQNMLNNLALLNVPLPINYRG